MDILLKYFPDLTDHQKEQFAMLEPLYREWNDRVNVISRKDLDNFYERHVLHSLGIARFYQFPDGCKVMDVGTGGGFPGIPLAILFPEADFLMVDSIRKKIKVVDEIITELGLTNANAIQERAENVKGRFHFVVSRAVTRLSPFIGWVRNSFEKGAVIADTPNGILYLKGGDLQEELDEAERFYLLHHLDAEFEEEFFETKKVVYVPMT